MEKRENEKEIERACGREADSRQIMEETQIKKRIWRMRRTINNRQERKKKEGR